METAPELITTYAEIVLPLPMSGVFTYRVPEAMTQTIKQYCRVVAPFGTKRYHTGIVTNIHNHSPNGRFKIKDIYAVLDGEPTIRAQQLSFWQWMANYYLCSLGEVFRAAMPNGLNAVLEYGEVGLSATPIQGFKPKKEDIIRLAVDIRTEEDIQAIFAMFRKNKFNRLEKTLTKFLYLSDSDSAPITKHKLLSHSSPSTATALSALIKRGILTSETVTVSRIFNKIKSETKYTPHELSEAQQKAYDEIRLSFETKNITLLHGVMSSGKTEIYLRLIADTLAAGQQALYMLPETLLDTYMIDKLRNHFGDRLLVYHSALSDNDKVEVWNFLLQSNEPCVVLGARSAIFLPFGRLGMVIVDEEQDISYKRQKPTPRYHARNAAMMLAQQHGAKTLLGSATPSLESYMWATNGKYGLVVLDSRYGGSLPDIQIVNISELRRKKQMKNTLLSPPLREKMAQALANGEQILLLHNRRGFAGMHICNKCNEVSRCIKCGVSLTYHKQQDRLICHYCGYTIATPSRCAACGSNDLTLHGFGTETVEDEVAALFPAASIARLDTDTGSNKKNYKQIVNDFHSGQTQILIGTQMIAKGLYCKRVSVVGIVNADVIMNTPDFRAYERAFQLFMQVSGCAGWRSEPGAVVLQTMQAPPTAPTPASNNPLLQIMQRFVLQTSQLPPAAASALNPANSLLQLVQRYDYRTMADIQLKERHALRYPPYARLINIVIKCSDSATLNAIAQQYVEKLRERFGYRVSDLIYPPISSMCNIMLRMELTDSIPDTRKILESIRVTMQKNSLFKNVVLYYDFDPQ